MTQPTIHDRPTLNLDITMYGPPASGKTYLTRLLKPLLTKHNISYSVEEGDTCIELYDGSVVYSLPSQRLLNCMGVRIEVRIKTKLPGNPK